MEAAKSIGAGSERVEEWALTHEALAKLRLKRAGLDAEEGTWLLRASRAATHVYFGYASFGEYVERLFGLRRRVTEEKLRVAEALELLPELTEALRSGELNWSAVRELSRVAVPETEREWIAVARRRTAREVERLVSGLARGDRHTDRRRSECVRHVMRFEVGAETLATFREAMRVLQKRSDHPLDDDAALLSMAREILRGPSDAGRASYQVVVTQCEDCGRGFQHANGELIELDPAIVEMCHCDAQTISVPQPHRAPTGAPDGRGTNADELAKGLTHAGLVDEFAKGRTKKGDSDQLANARAGAGDELARVDARRGRGADRGPAGLKRQRAAQETPPAIRREVFWRDRGRCIVPGCRNATYVDLHHLDLRSEGGSHDPDNLVVLCGAHHGALHRGRLRIDGRVSTGLRVRHADGTAYGFMPSPRLVQASAKAFAGLKNLGFSEKTARASLERALSGAPASATAEALLRSALARASCC
jgi:hypothetical protein